MRGLIEHFGIIKSYDMLSGHFYWPRMRHDVHKVYKRCTTCREAKSKSKLRGLYLPLPTPTWALVRYFNRFCIRVYLDLRGKRIAFLW